MHFTNRLRDLGQQMCTFRSSTRESMLVISNDTSRGKHSSLVEMNATPYSVTCRPSDTSVFTSCHLKYWTSSFIFYYHVKPEKLHFWPTHAHFFLLLQYLMPAPPNVMLHNAYVQRLRDLLDMCLHVGASIGILVTAWEKSLIVELLSLPWVKLPWWCITAPAQP